MAETEPPASLRPTHMIPIDTLMRTKFYRPRTSSDIVPRGRLLERLNSGLGGKLTLVCAPAGFGKTTLLVEWLKSSDRSTAWLSLDEHDNELPIFVHALATSMQTLFPDACQNTASLLNARQFPLPDQVATLVINDLADLPEDVILVLDDYHLIHTSEIHHLLNLLIEHLPPQLHLVLATRSDPPLSLSSWRARGYLHELRSTDLRFTLSETEAFLTGVLDNEVSHETASALEEVTEGWIALLRLVTLSLHRAADHATFIERLRNSPEKYVSGYLVEEVLSQQSPAVQALLLRISILDQFCADLCVAIMGKDTNCVQVQATLDWLEYSNMFLVPLDDLQGWYRFHHLFRVLLRQRMLDRSSTEELATLHHRASMWYAERGLIEEALMQALEAGDAPSAARLVEAQFLPLRERERWMLMERLLHLLPEEHIQSSPALLCARIWILQTRGLHTDLPRLLMAAEQLLAASASHTSDEGTRQFRLLHALIEIGWSHHYYRKGQPQSSLESARSALAWLPPGEKQVEIHALMYLAFSSQLCGQEDVAIMELNKGLRDHATNHASIAHLLIARALVYLAAGKLHHVEQTAGHLLETGRIGGLALSQNYAHWLLGEVYYERNHLEEAVYHFSVVLTNQHLVNFWAVQDTMYGLALAYQAQGLSKKAQEAANILLKWVQEQHNMDELKAVYAFCAQLALLQDEAVEASQWLELAGEQELLGPMRFLEDPPITKAYVLLAYGDEASVTRGQALLDDLLRHALAVHNTRKTIQVLALQAWVCDLQGRSTEALDVLERALALGRPGRYIRVFADLPPLASVLQKLRKRRKARQVVDNKFDAYLQSIQAAMIPLAASSASKGDLMRQEGLESLTERELHILLLLDKGHMNKEIACELVVTTGTVKVHTKNIYRKLGVNNRQAAVTLSKALGLLAEN
jgi:LuxR family transcriptional regulator, maltose regulon positive regulatory protein